MFYKEIKYGVMCDQCQKRLLGYDGLEKLSENKDNIMLEHGWVSEDGKHYCPDCYKKEKLKRMTSSFADTRDNDIYAHDISVVINSNIAANLSMQIDINKIIN